MLSCSVMSNSLRPCGLWPARIPVHGIFQARQSGLPFAPPGDLPNPGLESESLGAPALAGGFFTTMLPSKPFIFTVRDTQILLEKL